MTKLRAVGDGESVPRRDPVGMSIGVVFVFLAVVLITNWGGWWWLAIVPLLLFGLGGFAESAQKAPRDHAGRRIKEN
jgi:hypothetical protein